MLLPVLLSLAAFPLPHSPGDGVVRLRSDTFAAGWAYDDDGNLVDDPGFTTETVSASAEVGVAPHLTLDATLPLVFVPEPSGGDFDVGGLFTLLEAPIDLAVSLDVKAPLYEGVPSVRGRTPAGKPAVGDGQTDITTAAVLVARLPFDGAMDLYAGYRFRGGDVTDAVVGGGRVGIWAFDRRFFLSVLLDTVITFAARPDEVTGRGYAAFGPKLSVRVIDRAFLDVSALYVGRGTNSAGGAALGFGASLQF